MNILDDIIKEIEKQIKKSVDPNQLTKRTGDYRIGLRKAIDIINIVNNERKEPTEPDKNDKQALHIADVGNRRGLLIGYVMDLKFANVLSKIEVEELARRIELANL